MDGFGAAVSDYFDVENQLSRYLRERAANQFAAERDEKRVIDSQDSFERRRARVREAFRSRIGGLPERPDRLSDETTGVLQRDGYTVESVVFESVPNHHVTANCYVPAGDEPHPAVLFLCGHVETAKADPLNQRAYIELALNGFVVFIVDPLGQSERNQYCDPETGEAVVSGGGGVFEHCYAGQKCAYAGANLARYMIHDARCALDYLVGRADTDDQRIGVTGASGGGIQSLYLSLLDDRIDALAPCCAVTEREEWLKTGKHVDAEQAIHGLVPLGINYDDFVTALAPRPVCIGAAASDEYFPIEGAHETVERAQRIYDLYDAAENVELVVADTTHCSVYGIGNGVFEWFCETLGDTEYIPHDEVDLADRPTLWCTSDGSVRGTYPNERTIDDLIEVYIATNNPNAGITPVVDDYDEYTIRLRRRLVERLDLDRERCPLYPRHISNRKSNGLSIEHVWFRTERDPDAVVAGVLVADPTVAVRSPAVVLFEKGTEALPERTSTVESLAAEYGVALVFDPRGVGAVRNRPIPEWVDEYHDIYGTEFKLATDALLTGTSLLGLRTYDTLRAVEYLCERTGHGEVALVGEGIGAYHALYAGVAGRNVGGVALRDLGPSFYELATRREPPFRPQLTAFDMIDGCDVPHLVAALDEAGRLKESSS